MVQSERYNEREGYPMWPKQLKPKELAEQLEVEFEHKSWFKKVTYSDIALTIHVGRIKRKSARLEVLKNYGHGGMRVIIEGET